MTEDTLINQNVKNVLKNNETAILLLEKFLHSDLVLYFYPKDNTSGCTTQACALQGLLEQFQNAKPGIQIVGVSKDSQKSHDNFATQHGLTFPLISDLDGALCDAFGVWKEKSMYGKKYFGIERSTFYIDSDQIIRHIWRKVKVSNHWNDVIKTIVQNNAQFIK